MTATLRTLRVLESAGFDREQAEGNALSDLRHRRSAVRRPQALRVRGKMSIPPRLSFGLLLIALVAAPAPLEAQIEWVRRAAEQGFAEAQFVLGLMYDSGMGVPEEEAERDFRFGLLVFGLSVPRDAAEAVRWFRMAAEQGHIEAQFRLGRMYDFGMSVPEDNAEAVRWYRMAAEQGNARAQLRFGHMYDFGAGVPEDKAEAVRWYRMAAGQGNAEAQFLLGGMLAFGEGVPEDLVLAHMWLNIARANGYDVRILPPSFRLLTPSQIERATELARACMGSNYRECG